MFNSHQTATARQRLTFSLPQGSCLYQRAVAVCMKATEELRQRGNSGSGSDCSIADVGQRRLWVDKRPSAEINMKLLSLNEGAIH
jgi:hypothetical protein